MTASTMPFDVVFAHALRGEACTVRTVEGAPVPLPVEDWTRGADVVDRLFLRHCAGATIDVGCGPGRLTEELALAGHVVLGVDVVHEAVTQTRHRGGPALRRDVFDRVPGEGRWDTVLLADGNVGIGGDPAALLRRMRDLLGRGGRIVVEVEPPGRPTGSADVQLTCECASTTYFAWGRVGVDGLSALADRTNLTVRAVDRYDGRWCAVLGVRR
ncbi:methyltransferase domain-containing protein [Nocardioides sp. LHD-245]|uniref:class I SAM-dependent methyltransferase n=1 Tax=Nocardioides sp. LHD-245 TaxID=3051387 RepID=UPI0027E1E232|nr:methyltransferase domain-containing protein [Nocardioides sp. LHD-245]